MRFRVEAVLIVALVLALPVADAALAQADGSVAAWGYNGYAQCIVPAPNSGFTAVAAGWVHSIGRKTDGSLVAWGGNDFGQCTIPAPNSGFTAIAAGWVHSLGRKSDGSVAAWGWNDYGQCSVPAPNSGFTAVAAGWVHSLGRKSDGTVVAWGRNDYGQCSVPSPNSGFTAVAAGHLHSLGLKSTGSAVAWGRNDYGQCVIPSPNSGFTAIASGDNHCLALRTDGSIVAWGRNDFGQCNVPAPNSGFVAIAGGYYHSLGLKSDGTIVAWGNTESGQCAVAPPNSGFVGLAAGGLHSLGLRGALSGACCSATAVCTVTTQAACAVGSTWRGAGTTCNPSPCVPTSVTFVRGDVDANGETNIGDCVAVLRSLGVGYTFLCEKAADFDDSGEINIGDAIRCLRMSVGASVPAAPYPACGTDPTSDSRTCGCFPRCGTACATSADAVWMNEETAAPGRILAEARRSDDGAQISILVDTEVDVEIAALQFTVRYDAGALAYLDTWAWGNRPYGFLAGHADGAAVRVALVPDLELRSAIGAGRQRLAEIRFAAADPAALLAGPFRIEDAVCVSRDFRDVALAGTETPIPASDGGRQRQPGPALGIPNPYHADDTILFSAATTGRGEVAVYSVGGQRVRILFTGVAGPQVQQLRWDGRTESGARAGSGIYFLRAVLGDRQLRRTFLLTR